MYEKQPIYKTPTLPSKDVTLIIYLCYQILPPFFFSVGDRKQNIIASTRFCILIDEKCWTGNLDCEFSWDINSGEATRPSTAPSTAPSRLNKQGIATNKSLTEKPVIELGELHTWTVNIWIT